MDELFQLREYIERGRYTEALVLIGEMEEMSRDDKVQKIEGFLQVRLGPGPIPRERREAGGYGCLPEEQEKPRHPVA